LGAREPGVRGGRRMTGAPATPKVGGKLVALLAALAVLVLAAGIALFTQRSGSDSRAPKTVPTDALYGIAIDAESAVVGDAAALTNFQNRLAQLKAEAARNPSAAYVKDPRFAGLLTSAALVLQAHGSLTDASAAARETRELVPKLLAEMSTV